MKEGADGSQWERKDSVRVYNYILWKKGSAGAGERRKTVCKFIFYILKEGVGGSRWEGKDGV